MGDLTRGLIGKFFDALEYLPGHKWLIWRLAQRFIAGEDIKDVVDTARRLNRLGFRVIIDYVDEDNAGFEKIQQAEGMHQHIIRAAKEYDLLADVSSKASQFGFVSEHTCDKCSKWWEVYPEIILIAKRALDSDMKWWLDAELLSTRASLWHFIDFAVTQFKFTGVALQTYGCGQYDSLAFLQGTVFEILKRVKQRVKPDRTLGIRLCKGAYSEEFTLKDSDLVRQRYLAMADKLLEFSLAASVRARSPISPLYLEFATHDESLIDQLKGLIKSYHISRDDFRFAMLYGRKPDLASHLISEGYNVAIYLPFGKAWLPYIKRRIQEKPSYIVFPFLREGKYHQCGDWPNRCSKK